MVSYKFSGHLNSNLFVRPEHKISVTQLWSRYLVPIIEQNFSDAGLQLIKGQSDWDECLKSLIHIGALYLDQIRQTQEFYLDSNNVLRIHLMPKRYNSDLFQWDKNIIFENSEFLIVNKPALLPVHPTLDNCTENILSLIQQKTSDRIYCVHRLDLETTGLMLFAKGKESMAHFQKLFSSRSGIRKCYKAIVCGIGPIMGLYQHWMLSDKKIPKKIIQHEADGAVRVELTVRDKKQIHWNEQLLSVVDIELHTGRTHQIRAQMAHLGFPLVADRLYGGIPFSDHFFLHSYQLALVDEKGQSYDFFKEPNFSLSYTQ